MRSLSLACFLSLSLAPLSAQEAPLPWASPEEVGFSSDRLDAIPGEMQPFIDQGVVGGITTMVARRGRLVHWASVGYRDVGSRDPLDRDDIFRIYSMTKPITSVAVMMLVEEGALGLDDPVSKHLPALADLQVYADGELVAAERAVTVRDLLSHTSGMTYGLFGATPVDAMYRDADVFSGDLANLVEETSALPLLGQPGDIWNYGVSTDVLGRLVEVASGVELDTFFAERIFEPLGMGESGFFVPADRTDEFVTNYTLGRDGSLQVFDTATDGNYNARPALLSGGGGLVSTPSDYVRFAQMLLNGGELDGVRLLRAETVDLMRTNRLPDELIPIAVGSWSAPGYGFGLGFSVLTDPEATPEPDNTGVFRWWGYASTYFWIDPADELIGIVLTQLTPPMAPQIERRFQTLVYEALER